jgi:two-component system sensor histidine kinase DegS
MEAQVDILEGKLKILTRFKESLRRYSAELDRASMGGAVPQHTADKLDTSTPLPPAVSRLVLAAQEDLRREIARAMHDGPAQSLTNIVLQAQIVERLLDRDPPRPRRDRPAHRHGPAHARRHQDVHLRRPADGPRRSRARADLRRVARDRGRRSQVPIEFESYGSDRRLPMDVESALFRIIDETVTGFLSCHPDRVSIRFEWAADKTEARISARREGDEDRSRSRGRRVAAARQARQDGRARDPRGAQGDDRRDARGQGQRAARANQPLALPPNTWREVQQRSDTIGVTAELVDEGREVVLVLPAS